MSNSNYNQIKFNDSMDYLSVIKKAFPDAMIQQQELINNIYHGYIVVINACNIIRFGWIKTEELKIHIEKCTISYYLGLIGLTQKTLFSGTVPCIPDDGPDFDFIEKIIKNYKSIGI